MAAWRQADALTREVPRFTPGSIRMLDYELKYLDLLSFCPQWHDIFVDGALEFRADSAVAADSRLRRQRRPGQPVLQTPVSRRHESRRTRPTRRCSRCFAHNLDVNGAADVETVHAALWTANGRVTFRAEGSDSGMIGTLAGAVAGTAVDVPSLRLRDLIERDANGRIDLLKLDIEGAEDAVLADCEPVLHRIAAIVMDLHEFDPADRQAPRVLELLTRNGFTYAVDEFVPQPWRPPVAPPTAPFPAKALVWSMTVRAWRA